MKNDENAKKSEFEITELFMADAGLERYFIGSMRRGKDEEGNDFVSGRVKVIEGLMIGRAENMKIMSDQLDIVSKLKLDYDLHGRKGKTSTIFGTEFNHN